MMGSSDKSGALMSRSHRLTVLSDTLSLSARSRCVMPAAVRSAAMKAPIDFAIFVPSFCGLPRSS